MILTLLLLGAITLNMYEITGNAIPIERSPPQYLDFPEENIKEYYKKRQSSYFYPKNSFGYKRNVDITDVIPISTDTPRRITPMRPSIGESDPIPGKPLNSSYIDISYFDMKKRSFNSLELYEKLIALGVDYVEVMNLLTPLHQATKDFD